MLVTEWAVLVTNLISFLPYGYSSDTVVCISICLTNDFPN